MYGTFNRVILEFSPTVLLIGTGHLTNNFFKVFKCMVQTQTINKNVLLNTSNFPCNYVGGLINEPTNQNLGVLVPSSNTYMYFFCSIF